jgi:hypothetical protein
MYLRVHDDRNLLVFWFLERSYAQQFRGKQFLKHEEYIEETFQSRMLE